MRLNVVTLTLILAVTAAAAPARTNENPNSNTNSGNINSNGNTSNNSSGNGSSNNNNRGNSNSGNNTNLSTSSGNSNGSGTNVFQPASNTANNGAQNGNKTTDNAAPQNGANSANQPSQVDAATAALMSTAVNAWMMDTGVVSNFLLNIGNSLTDEMTFKNQAQIAHSAEVDELTHKAVLDQFMPNNVNVQKANSTLSNGAFQLVVDRLEDMAMQGRSQIQGITDINNDRCVNVLPNIDAYMREAALTIGNGQPIQQSVRPSACANIIPGQSGAAQVGMPPAGYVNGKLQNGNSNT